jgi:hypothetical protein
MATATQKVGDGTTTVTRDDIEAKLREIRGDIDTVGDNAKQYALVAGAVVAVAVVALAFTLGKRKGRKKRTVVEVRRV